MRNTASVARRFIETRADWKRNLLPGGDPVKAGKAEVATRALAWTLGIDLDLLERPKVASDLFGGRADQADAATLPVARQAQVSLDAAGSLAIIPIDALLGGERWYLLDVPPHVYADGLRTELWSALFSGAQLEELRKALVDVDGYADAECES